jgi:hypothetical protein
MSGPGQPPARKKGDAMKQIDVTRSRSAARACVAVVLAAATFAADATDLAVAKPHTRLDDLTAQVNSRRLHLPPGHWVLVARREVETTGKQHRAGAGIEAWLAQTQGGALRALVHLSLPLEDYPRVHTPTGNRCPEEDGIQRADLSPNPGLPECLGIYGHRDLLEAMASRSQGVVAWMDKAGIANPGAVVRFTYRQRTDNSYGGITLFLPTAHFESDEVASAWARQLRAACAPLFESSSGEATLPSTPVAPAPDQ